MKKENENKKAFSLKERFRYWFDNRMTKGSLGLIRVLIIATVILAVAIALIIIVSGLSEDKEAPAVIWDSIATVLNAWMPYFEEGSIGYLILMSLIAIAGVLFTSVLIGIITSAIEERIENLKKGNSLVVESGHTVVLGFYPGEYTLIEQLVLAASGEKSTIVIAEDMEREEMEQYIDENIELPKGVKIVCRTVDITDPASIEKCSVEKAKTVIVSPTDDIRTVKAILAVSSLLAEKGEPEIAVNAIISGNEYSFPKSLLEANNISTLQTNMILSKMIAHSCTQNGLSETFREIFNFEGFEIYISSVPGTAGKTFADAVFGLDKGVPVGILHDKKVLLNPAPGTVISEADRLIVFAEDNDSAVFSPASSGHIDVSEDRKKEEKRTSALIICGNESLPTLLGELPVNVEKVTVAFAGMTDEMRERIEEVSAARSLQVTYSDEDPHDGSSLEKLASGAEHIVVLNDHEKDPDDADMEVIFMLLSLRDIRKRMGEGYNITVEMRKESNQRLASGTDHTDFLVSSNMGSLILANLAESPELIDVFREILSNEGSEIYLKNAADMDMTGTFTLREIRERMLGQGCLVLGILDPERISRFDISLDEKIELGPDHDIIVLCEE